MQTPSNKSLFVKIFFACCDSVFFFKMFLKPDFDELISNRLFPFIPKGIMEFTFLYHIGDRLPCVSEKKNGVTVTFTMGDRKTKYTGNIYLSAGRKQGGRPKKRQMENARKQRNMAVGIVKIVEPGKPNTQRLYVSDKADKALEEKKKINM